MLRTAIIDFWKSPIGTNLIMEDLVDQETTHFGRNAIIFFLKTLWTVRVSIQDATIATSSYAVVNPCWFRNARGCIIGLATQGCTVAIQGQFLS